MAEILAAESSVIDIINQAANNNDFNFNDCCEYISTSINPNPFLPDQIDSSSWPLHVKDVPRIDLDRLRDLPAAPPSISERNNYCLLWTTDANRYAVLDTALYPPRTRYNTPYTKLTPADVNKMLEMNVIRRIHPDEVRGHMRLFPVPEFFKQRRRPIRHTEDINDVLGRETLLKLDMATKVDIISLVHLGDWAVAFDAAAFFDQFALHPDVGARMCFMKGHKYYAATTAPMGQRQSVEVAHTTMQKLIHHPDRECCTAAIIDNSIFVGTSKDMCIRDGQRFVERCAHVSCKLNEDTSDIEQLVSQRVEWGGIGLDFKNKTTRLTQKMVDKLNLSWSLRARWTLQSFAAHMGCLFWTVGIVAGNPGDYYPALQFYATVCSEFSRAATAPDYDKKRYWNQPAYVPRHVLESLAAWTAHAVQNTPNRVPHPTAADHLADWLVCVDACSEGFGYVAVCPRTGETRHHGQRWDDRFRAFAGHRLRQSVFTEPEAAVLSMCHLLAYDPERKIHVHVWTDSTTTMAAANKGYNVRSEHINECMQRLRASFPETVRASEPNGGFRFTFDHIAGKDNYVADALSRGKKVSFAEVQGEAAD